jgi:hypothetical protein
MSRQDQYNVTVVIVKGDETKRLGTFDKLSGGEIDSEEVKYRPGAMGPQITLGGYRNVGNLTVSRLYQFDRDHAIAGWLSDAVGKATVTVSKQPLDIDGNVTGKALVYSGGKLKRVQFPEHDSESSDAALVELEVSTGSTVTIAD